MLILLSYAILRPQLYDYCAAHQEAPDGVPYVPLFLLPLCHAGAELLYDYGDHYWTAIRLAMLHKQDERQRWAHMVTVLKTVHGAGAGL